MADPAADDAGTWLACKEVNLDDAEAAWEQAEALTLEAARAEGKAEARDLRLRAELEAELARALLVADEAAQRARQAERVAAKLRRRAARADQPDVLIEADREPSRAAERKSVRAAARAEDAWAAAAAAAEAAFHATPPLDPRQRQLEAKLRRMKLDNKRRKAGVRRRRRDRARKQAADAKGHAAWLARCLKYKARSRRLHIGDDVVKHERAKRKYSERAAHDTRHARRVRAATAELVVRAAVDVAVAAAGVIQRAVTAIRAVDRARDRADRKCDRRAAAGAAAAALRALAAREPAAKRKGPIERSAPLRAQICYLQEPRAALDVNIPAAWAAAAAVRLLNAFRPSYAAQAGRPLPAGAAGLFTLGGASLAGCSVREAVALAGGRLQVRVGDVE